MNLDNEMQEDDFEQWKQKKKEKKQFFTYMQNLPYEIKVKRAKIRINEFITEMNARNCNAHVSVGGLDSIVLLLFIRSMGINIPAISVSGVEDKSIQEIHKQLGVIRLKHFAKNSRMKLPQKWLQLFAGMANKEYGTRYYEAPFRVSNKCCYYLKEKPCDDWAREHNSHPFLGLMASEGGQREEALVEHGCNYYGKTVIRSAPFAPFLRQDLLQLALDLNVPVPEIYGEIKRKPDGTLYTTKAQRTGCSMCGFGIHMEKRPHRFDRLRESNPKEWHFWMYECCTDNNTGEKYGWGKVLDWIGVEWEDIPPVQMTVEDLLM